MTSSGDLCYGTRRYGLDEVGNRATVTSKGATTAYTLKPNQMTQYATVGGATLTYDARGNRTSDRVRTNGLRRG